MLKKVSWTLRELLGKIWAQCMKYERDISKVMDFSPKYDPHIFTLLGTKKIEIKSNDCTLTNCDVLEQYVSPVN